MADTTIPTKGRDWAGGIQPREGVDIIFKFSTKILLAFLALTIIPDIANTEYEGDFTNAYGIRIKKEIEVLIQEGRVIGADAAAQRVEREFIDFIPDQSAHWHTKHDLEELHANTDLFAETAESAARRMKVTIEKNCFAHWYLDALHTGASAGKNADINLGSPTAPLLLTPGNILEELTGWTLIFDQFDVPENQRNLVLPKEIIRKLKNSDLASYMFTGEKSQLVHPDAVMEIDGWTIYGSNNLTYVLDTGDVVCNAFASQQQALGFVTTLEKQQQINQPNFVTLAEGLHNYGRQTLRKESVIHLYLRVA